ncbi:MAG: WhiB family transcriptional regulator [Brooklawnia sp.]|uniref:WhiB family transcriptional regulator n=1 Tax=Brooklawnia sp. TaxID=2699740 RepID=UPI003C77D320
MAVPDPEDWPLLAKCRGMNDALFPEGKDQKRAKTICMGCPVRAQCLAEALDNRIEWGVWGGMTERERRQLLRQRPDVKSWSAVLNAAVSASKDVRVVDSTFDADASAQRRPTSSPVPSSVESRR